MTLLEKWRAKHSAVWPEDAAFATCAACSQPHPCDVIALLSAQENLYEHYDKAMRRAAWRDAQFKEIATICNLSDWQGFSPTAITRMLNIREILNRKQPT